MRFRLVMSLFAACLIPVEATWSSSASAQEEAPAPALPSLPPTGGPALAPPPAPLPPEGPNSVKVHVVTNATSVQILFRPAPAPASNPSQGGTDGDLRQYSATCLAPCDLALPPGDYFVALSRSAGRAYESPTPVALRTATTLAGTYESHSASRVTGIVLLSSLVPIGAVVALEGAVVNSCSFDSACGSDSGVIAFGITTMLVGVVLGAALITRHDAAAVQVIPQATAQLAIPGTRTERSSDSNGLALRFAF